MIELPKRRGGRIRTSAPKFLFAAVLVLTSLGVRASGLNLKQVAYLSRGLDQTFGRVVQYRPFPDSSPLLVFRGNIPYTWNGVYYYRNLPWNRYHLVKVDTGNGNMGSGMVTGNMLPWAAADVDSDGRPELLAKNSEYLPNKTYLLATLYANPIQRPCPDSLVWRYRYDSLVAYSSEPFYITDLDQDDKAEIVFYHSTGQRLFIFENAGPDSFRLAWTDALRDGSRLAFGDFDRDGRMEFATAGISYGWVRVLKCTADDQYALWDSVLVPLPHGQNGHDVFAARNLDGSNRAQLFVSFTSFVRSRTYLYMFEPTQGTRGHEAVLVDSSSFRGDKYAQSCCADVDGDGIEELFWSCGTHILAYRQTGPRQFEQVWYWSNQDSTSANLTAYDVNGNGYNELIVSGSSRTFIFETEAIRVLSPNGGELLRPGDTAFVRWQNISPPRCDSVSLFLRRDTSWTLDTIATGLAASDTSYRWLVPDTPSDSCRIIAIAHGPVWQYDESDRRFSIRSSGVEESRASPVSETRLLGAFPALLHLRMSIRFQLRERRWVELRICDVTGRTVANLADGILRSGLHELTWDAGSIPSGVYVLTFAAAGRRETRRLTVIR